MFKKYIVLGFLLVAGLGIFGCGLFSQTTAPSIVSVTTNSSTSLAVLFNGTPDSSATNKSNYAVKSLDETTSLEVTAASLGADGVTVALTTSQQTANTTYKLAYSSTVNVVLNEVTTIDANVGALSSADDTAIGTDSNNKAHIAYYNDNIQGPKYATNISGSWGVSTIEAGGSVHGVGGYGVALGIDSNNKPQVSYSGGFSVAANPTPGLRYSDNSTGSWVKSIIGDYNAGEFGRYSAIGVDNNDKTYVGFQANGTGYLKYYTNANGSWEGFVVDKERSQKTSLVIDTNNKLHFAYYGEAGKKIKYATNASGTWITQEVAAVEYIVDSVVTDIDHSIAIDGNGKIHIVYDDRENAALRYATNTSGAWVVSTLANVGSKNSVSTNPCIKVDANGKLYVTYVDASGALKIATNVTGAWLFMTVVKQSSGYPSLAIGTNGKKYLSYYEGTGTTTKVKYASF
ncbi:MAG: hypothetical protein ABIH50_00220 [bacterium]